MDGGVLLTSENTTPSSRAPVIFSDHATRASTPPSSPPGFPWDKQDTNAHVTIATTPSTLKPSAFSILGKRKALDAIPHNARPNKKIAVLRREEGKSLTQMQISLGQEVQKTCKVCGMEYAPASAVDRALHEKYHRQITEGYDLGTGFVRATRQSSVFACARKGDVICAIDCFDTQRRKAKGQAVLEMVQKDLGAVAIPEHELWDAKNPTKDTLPRKARFRAYLYVRGTRCIGLLLAQRIEEAHRVLKPVPGSRCFDRIEEANRKTSAAALQMRRTSLAEQLRQPLQLSMDWCSARLGISRIWTSPPHRHQHIATAMLDVALGDYNQWTSDCSTVKVESDLVTKDMVAFSQPTEAGTRLARRWFGKPYGWSVYLD